MARRVWPWRRWLGALFGKKRGGEPGRIPKQDTLARRLDSAVRGNKERDLLRGAEESLRRGRRDEAIRAYRAALEVFMDRGAYQKAIAVLTTLTRLEPSSPAHFERLAEVQEQLGRRPEAELSRRQAAALHEASGAHARAVSLRQPGSLAAASSPRLHVERARSAPVGSAPERPAPATAFSGGPRAPVPNAVSEVGPLDLGPLERELEAHEDEDRPHTLPPEHLVAEGEDATVAMPAVTRGTPVEPPLPAFEPLAPGVPPADTDPAEVFGARTQAFAEGREDDELDLPEVGALSMSPLPAGEAYEEDVEDDFDDAGDRTLYDPSFVAGHEAPAPSNRPRGLAIPVTEAPTPTSARRPTRTGGPRGLAIPGASTVLDPRGSGALESSEHRRPARRPSDGSSSGPRRS